MVLLSLAYHTEVISGYNIYVYVHGRFILLFNCVLVQCAHSLPQCPAVPEPDPWAVGGEYSGVQGLISLTSARGPPPAGFATLSASPFLIFPLPITIEHSMHVRYVTVQSVPPQSFVNMPVNAT